MRPPRLRCTLFPLIYPPHLLDSYKRQLYGFVLFSRLTKRNLASYVISVRRTKSSLTASFRFYLTIDTLAVQLYTSLSPRRVRDFHPLERAHGAQTKIRRFGQKKNSCRGRWIIFLSLFCFSLFWPGMPYFARDSGVIVKYSEITDYGKSEQNPASCYYLLVVKLVVKGKGLLLRIVY